MTTLIATHLGSFARDILAGGGEATVIAVFERSLYLLCPKGIIAVCDEALGRGPINVLLRVPAGWTSALRVDGKAKIAADAIALVDGPVIATSGAPVWQAPPLPAWQDVQVREGVVRLRDLTIEAIDGDLARGLAPLVLGVSSPVRPDPMLACASDLVASIARALPDALASRRWPADALTSATLLVGLGPGLTPSGDDVLGGLMLALSARGELRLRDQLWDQIVDELDDLTVPVSAMHLTAAAHGMGHEALHDLINAVLAGEPDNAKLDAVLALGATSGIDAVAGLLLGLSG